MNKTIISALSLAAFLPGCGPDSKPKKDSKQTSGVERPNIVLFVVDDLGTNDAGCYGNDLIKTPGIDALAKEGTRFNYAYCTSPSCSASRSVILSGKYNHANGQYGHSHFEFHFSALPSLKTLPVILDSVGYRTRHVGKFHIAPKEVFKFDEYFPSKEEYPNKVWKSIDEAPYYPFANSFRPDTLADMMTDFVADKSSPFFLYFNTFEPHHPFRRAGSDTIMPADIEVPSHMPDIPWFRKALSKYYMSTQRADRGVKRLIEVLKEAGQWENTIFIFTSDNGRPFWGAKGNLYEPGIRLPFVMYDPFVEQDNNVTDAMINFADITPTLLDYAGVDISKYGFHGKSFREVLSGKEGPKYDTVYASHTFHEIQQYNPMRMVRDRKYKLIWNLAYGQGYPTGGSSKSLPKIVKENNLTYIGKRTLEQYLKRPKYELFDMENDPEEINNLADDPEYKEILETYIKKLHHFQNSTDDIWNIYQHYNDVEELLEE